MKDFAGIKNYIPVLCVDFGGRLPIACPGACRIETKNKSRNERRAREKREVKDRLPTVQEVLDYYNERKHDFEEDPNMGANFHSV